MRKSPNIVITGTPGVGKTSHAEQLAEVTELKHLAINQLAKDRDCLESFDEELKSWNVDEDKLLDSLEADVQDGGCILDWHACELFPERWIDLVVVLRTDSTKLYDRMVARGYSGKKLEENMDSEIMQVVLEEARGAYNAEIVIELQSDTADDVEANVERVAAWVEQWKKEH